MCTRGTVSVASGGFTTSNSNSFSKDGRKIRVGDCALFEPPQNSLPFIGIVRCLITSKECNLKFGVNWLYRASEVELEKGTHLDAAPNEIFYSFHEDEVPAAALLHPCKVAFLPAGVELPSGISSFICRRVYDINQKCLWWLTDQNYIDKRQEEVDRLLSKTRREMHATAQPGGRSPKTLSDMAPTSQVKASSDGAQNVSSSSSHGKGKKRERSDQDSEPVKRVQRKEDSESQKSESFLKSEIARITDRGSLVDHESVEKLIQLMTPDKKIDLTGRSVLAGVVAATDKFDCLSWFVQLRGLPVFDEWLQEIQKGKIGDANSQKDGDKSVEEFLLVLFRALDKLPVNLRALQMCNIGKSVNHLRSHKNLEIQRKARSLVDTWKKRVEAEMNIDDGKPSSNVGVAWHGRRTSELSQGGHRNSGSSENVMKSSSSQVSAHKVLSTKPTQNEMAQTTASTSPGYSKSTSSPTAGGEISKDAQPKNVAVGESPDHPPTAGKDDKSSSTSQSHSQSSSSDQIKAAESSGKEDTRNSTAGSVGAGEALRRTSRLRKTVSGLPEPVSRGAQRDESNRSPLHKASIHEKLTWSGSVSEKMHDIHVADGNGHKLIVKIPNRSCSPAVCTNGGSADEPCPSNNRATSPTCLDKLEKPGFASKEKGDASLINDASDMTTKSWHSSDLKEALTGSDEADGTSAVNHEEVRSTNGDHTRRLNVSPKDVSSYTEQELKPWKSHKSSFSSMNALVESCVKHSEANALISAADDVGMKLLASVAASEMIKCDMVGTNSPEKTFVAEDSVIGSSEKSLNKDNSTQEPTLGTDNVKHDSIKQEESTSLVTNGGEVGVPSSDKKLPTELSASVLLTKYNDGQLSDSRDVPSNEVPLDMLENQKEEINESESEALSINGEDCKNSKKEKSPSTALSEAVGANKRETLLDSETSLGKEKAVAISNSQSCMDQKPNKTESTAGPTSASSDNSGNETGGKPQNIEIPCHGIAVSDLSKASTVNIAECPSTGAPHASSTNVMEKRGFDLNEGFTAEDVKDEEQRSLNMTMSQAAVHVISPIPFPVSAMSNGLPASVTLATAAKGAFVPPEDLLRIRKEIGWKGSAATSAFRPAEPRKVCTPSSDAPSKSSRPFLNIDLNFPDNSMQDDYVSHSGAADLPRNEKITHVGAFGGFDLNLNQIDEATEAGQYSANTSHKIEISRLPSKPSILSNGETSGRRNFDLNDGPFLEEVSVEASKLGQNIWNHMPSQPPVVSLRMNSAEMGNYASWFPHSNVIPAVTIPSVLPDRSDQAFSIATSGTSQRIYYTPPGSTPFTPDVYTGPVLSSSPALSFPSTPYQYPPMFPFGASYPVNMPTYMESSSGGRHNLPASGQSQYIGHPGLISSSYPRPYLVSVPDGRSNGGGLENNNRWGGSHGLDLNTGPGSIEVDSRNEGSQFGLRQFTVASSQAFADDQARMFQAAAAAAAGVVMKRKEPDGGWGDAEKQKQQPSWHTRD